MARARVAVIEEDEDFRLLLALWLSPRYGPFGFPDLESVLRCAEQVRPEALIVNVRPRADEVELLRWRALAGDTPALLLSWHALPRIDGRTRCLKKPFRRDQLLSALDGLLESQRSNPEPRVRFSHSFDGRSSDRNPR